MPVVEKVVADTQFGSGLNAGSTEMTYLVQMAAEGAADARNLSSISLYIDTRSAFAEVQRCLVVEDFNSKDVLHKALVAYGLGEDLVAGIIGEVADTGFWLCSNKDCALLHTNPKNRNAEGVAQKEQHAQTHQQHQHKQQQQQWPNKQHHQSTL